MKTAKQVREMVRALRRLKKDYDKLDMNISSCSASYAIDVLKQVLK